MTTTPQSQEAMNSSRAQPASDLLGSIQELRARIGEGLNDTELTCLLREMALRAEAGFKFLSFSDGVVTLSVPEQDLRNWYPENGWTSPEKETIGKAIADKCALSLFEPVDAATSFGQDPKDRPNGHHHLEWGTRRQTIIVAHPQYLKVRLFGRPPDYRYTWEGLCPLTLGPDLLDDLSALYAPNKRLP